MAHAVSASSVRSERMSPSALALALLLHALVALALWWMAFDRKEPPAEEAIEVTLEQPKVEPPKAEQPKPPPPPPPKPPEAARQPPPPPKPLVEPGLRPPAPLTADKPTQVPPDGGNPDKPPAPPPPPLQEALPSPNEPSPPTAAEIAKAAPPPPTPAPTPPPVPQEQPAGPQQKQALAAPQPQAVPMPAPQEHPTTPPQKQALVAPPAPHALPTPQPPKPPVPPRPQPQRPELRPSPLTTAPPMRPPGGRHTEDPSPSPFVNPADVYNRARVADNYLWQVVRKLQGYTYQANVNASRGITVVRIVIARDGRLLDVAVTQSSGYAEFDRGVLAGVRAGSPYTPLPPDIKGDSATFSLPLVSVHRQ